MKCTRSQFTNVKKSASFVAIPLTDVKSNAKVTDGKNDRDECCGERCTVSVSAVGVWMQLSKLSLKPGLDSLKYDPQPAGEFIQWQF